MHPSNVPTKNIKQWRLDFPFKPTVVEIAKEHQLFTKSTNIVVLGQSGSGKTSVIDAILCHNHSMIKPPSTAPPPPIPAVDPDPLIVTAPIPRPRRPVPATEIYWRPFIADKLKAKMVRSQYELEYGNVTEYVMDDMAQSAASNLKYFPVLKDPMDSVEIEQLKITLESAKKPEFKYPLQERRWRRRQIEKIEPVILYRRLRGFSPETLDESRERTNLMVTNRCLLFSGFIREIVMSQQMDIPSDVMALMEAYYGTNQFRIESFKFKFQSRFSRFREDETLNLQEMDAVHSSFWWEIKRRPQLDGIILVVDLTSYDEYFVDENGQRVNKLEHALSVWKSYRGFGSQLSPSKMVLFTKKDLFMDKLKTTPLRECPLFRDHSESDCTHKGHHRCACQPPPQVYDVICERFYRAHVSWTFAVDATNRYEVLYRFREYHSRLMRD